ASKAIHYGRLAGQQALERLAYEDAATHFQHVLQALDLDSPDERERRGDLLLALGDAQRRAGELRQAMGTFQDAAAVARSTGAGELLARAALGYEDAMFHTGAARAGSEDPSVRLLEDAAAALDRADSALRARVLAGLARALHFAGAHERA